MQLEYKTFQIGLVDIGFGGNLHEIRRYDRSQQDVTALYPTRLHSEHQSSGDPLTFLPQKLRLIADLEAAEPS